ncbi:endodeoxyribonuclease [Coemansia sp. RSA 552]|nr:endodeoxyribonuclease [Coemansia sp. RSA 552]
MEYPSSPEPYLASWSSVLSDDGARTETETQAETWSLYSSSGSSIDLSGDPRQSSGPEPLSDCSEISYEDGDEADTAEYEPKQPLGRVSTAKIRTFSEQCLLYRIHSLIDNVSNGELPLSALCRLIGSEHPNYGGEKHANEKGLQVLCILETAHQLLSSGQVAYQRDVYYRHKEMLKSVENVRCLCQKIALFFEVAPASLNVISCPKGLMYGRVAIELCNGTVVEFTGQNQRVVLQEDTAFLALLESGFRERFPQAILVTGRGYPDINTREIVRQFPEKLSVALLVDYDPDGAHIYQVYTEGGLGGAQKWAMEGRWAGLHCTTGRIGPWQLDTSKLAEFTGHDWALGLRLVRHWAGSAAAATQRRAMARMVYRGKKAELEVITERRQALMDYVEWAISR